MNDLTVTDKHITISEAAKLIPGRPNVSTVHRWANKGVRGVLLESVRAGGRRYTTPGYVAQFLSKLNKSEDERLKEDGC